MTEFISVEKFVAMHNGMAMDNTGLEVLDEITRQWGAPLYAMSERVLRQTREGRSIADQIRGVAYVVPGRAAVMFSGDIANAKEARRLLDGVRRNLIPEDKLKPETPHNPWIHNLSHVLVWPGGAVQAPARESHQMPSNAEHKKLIDDAISKVEKGLALVASKGGNINMETTVNAVRSIESMAKAAGVPFRVPKLPKGISWPEGTYGAKKSRSKTRERSSTTKGRKLKVTAWTGPLPTTLNAMQKAPIAKLRGLFEAQTGEAATRAMTRPQMIMPIADKLGIEQRGGQPSKAAAKTSFVQPQEGQVRDVFTRRIISGDFGPRMRRPSSHGELVSMRRPELDDLHIDVFGARFRGKSKAALVKKLAGRLGLKAAKAPTRREKKSQQSEARRRKAVAQLPDVGVPRTRAQLKAMKKDQVWALHAKVFGGALPRKGAKVAGMRAKIARHLDLPRGRKADECRLTDHINVGLTPSQKQALRDKGRSMSKVVRDTLADTFSDMKLPMQC